MSNVPPPIPPQQPGRSMPPAMPRTLVEYAPSGMHDHNRLLKIAKAQRNMNLLALMWIAIFALTQVFFGPSSTGQRMLPQFVPAAIVLTVLFFATWAGFIVCMVMLTLSLDNVPLAILIGIIGCIPLLNLIPIVVQSRRANDRLRASGYSVGLMGADLKQFS